MKNVIIASKNPVKINAVKIAFDQMFPSDVFEFNINQFEDKSIKQNTKNLVRSL